MGRILQVQAALTTAALSLFLLAGFKSAHNAHFDQITVERIDVVDKEGHRRMVISNDSRMPGPMQKGELLAPSGGRKGMIFYNEEGTEDGGLIFSGKRVDGKITAVGSLTFDQFEHDQTVALQYVDDNGTRRAGLAITDYPTNVSIKEFMDRAREIGLMPDGPEKDTARQRFQNLRPRPRLYVGRARDDGSSIVSLSDAAGKVRLRLRVGADGDAAIEFLDNTGHVSRRLAPSDLP